MDIKGTGKSMELPRTGTSENQDGNIDFLRGTGSLRAKSPGNISSKDMIFRADKVDLKNLDLQLEKHLSRVWSRNIDTNQRPKEEWEIDPSKLEIRYLIAQGTYGTVYRGTYDSQDVAGIRCCYYCFAGLIALLLPIICCITTYERNCV